MTQWCYGLKCLCLALGYTNDTTMCRRRDTKDQTVVSCRRASILLADKKCKCMAISIVMLIPGGDPGDKRTVAFGASENSRRIGYLRSPISVEMRLISHSWCRKMMKAGSCRSTDVTKLLQKQRRDSQCNGIGLFRILSTGKTSVHLSRNPQGRKFDAITPEIAASQSPSKIWRAAGKLWRVNLSVE